MNLQSKRLSSIARRAATVLVLLLLPVAVAACTTELTMSRLDPQSHFDYPNSNVVPLGHVQAAAAGECQDMGLLVRNAMEKAIASKGGDLLVNYRTLNVISITIMPYLPVPVITCETRVEGTAAKMEIGRKPLQ